MTPAASTQLKVPAHDDHWLSVTKPTAMTRFFRTFLPWQVLRFLFINFKMLRIIAMSHHPKR
jgi:hypothetical protein